jgi:hypothetical protein
VKEQKQDEGFKVVDRRLFTEAGELRKDAIDQERREQEAAANRPPSPAGPAEPKVVPANPAQAGAVPAPAAAEEEESSRAFQMLIDLLTRNAAAMMGGMNDPRSGQPFFDLEGAREVIDMIDVLREKTRGNLAKPDEDLLLEITGSLKLTFMEVSKAAAEAMAKKAKGKP